MGKKHMKVFIAVFLCMIFLPQMIFIGAKGKIPTSTNEGRELASAPGLLSTPIRKFPAKFSDYFNDHLPFRRQLKTGWADLQYLAFDEVLSFNSVCTRNSAARGAG